MKSDNPKTLLRFLIGAVVAFRRKQLTTFVLGPVLLEPFVKPIFEAFREEHRRFLQENFSDSAEAQSQGNTDAKASDPEFLH